MAGRLQARWSAQAHDDWKRNLLSNRPYLTQEHLDRASAQMDRAIPGGLVTDHESLIAGLTLPDPDDRHALAAAIRCNSSVIVTFNVKDFPVAALEPFGIEAQLPDVFIANLFDLDQAAVVAAARRQRARLRNPPMDVERQDVLRRRGLVQTAKSLGIYQAIL